MRSNTRLPRGLSFRRWKRKGFVRRRCRQYAFGDIHIDGIRNRLTPGHLAKRRAWGCSCYRCRALRKLEKYRMARGKEKVKVKQEIEQLADDAHDAIMELVMAFE